MVKFKAFSRSLSVLQVLFKANLIFKDFSFNTVLYIQVLFKPVRTLEFQPCHPTFFLIIVREKCSEIFEHLPYNTLSSMTITCIMYKAHTELSISEITPATIRFGVSEFNAGITSYRYHIREEVLLIFVYDLLNRDFLLLWFTVLSLVMYTTEIDTNISGLNIFHQGPLLMSRI